MTAPSVAQRDGGDADQRAVAYVRISTSGQADGYGISIQEAAVAKYLKQNPRLKLLRTYSDQGSGADLNRAGLQQLLRDSSHREFSKVIVARNDRLSRDLYGQLFIEKNLLVHDIEVISCAEPFAGKDPITAALKQVTIVFAALERQLIRDRMLSGRKQKLAEGGFAGGRPPLGYCVQNGGLIIDTSEAEIIQKIRHMRMGRHSYSAIARSLNTDGLKTKLGKPFSDNTIKYVLHNRSYKGFSKYGEEVRGHHEPIR